jgi:hypothetical protein
MIFLDSGAFSAWSKGERIDINAYMDFISKHAHLVDAYCNLDVIGNAEETWENQEIMEREGYKPLPVFHLEEAIKQNFQYLDRCLEYDHFCLGGMAKGFSTKDREYFMDRCWEIICDPKDAGMPRAKVHGLGMAVPALIAKYPWYSIDTTSWVMYGRYGIVLIPKSEDYTQNPAPIFFSDRSPSKMEIDGRHFTSLVPILQNRVRQYVEEQGYTVEELAEDWTKRDELNLIYYLDLEAAQPPWPWAWRPREGKVTMERFL